MKPHDALADPRIANLGFRAALMLTLLVLMTLVGMEPVAAWDTTSMPSAGGSSTYWWEGSSSDPV